MSIRFPGFSFFLWSMMPIDVIIFVDFVKLKCYACSAVEQTGPAYSIEEEK